MKKTGYIGIGVLIGVVAAVLVVGIGAYKEVKNIENQYVEAYEKALDDIFSTPNLELTEDGIINQAVVDQVNTISQYLAANFYYTENIDVEKMRDGIYRSIIASLDDAYAEYYDPDEFADFFDETEGVYYGIGSYVQKDEATGYVLLTGIFDASPAQKAGLLDGDMIVEADGNPVKDLTLTEAVNMIKGPQGTDTVLTILREGESDYLYVTVTRDKVESPTVTHEMLENEIGYIKLERFEDVTTAQFEEALKDLKKQEMKALIIDLRDNGGGNLSTVLDISEMLLPKGLITYTEDKYGYREEFFCTGMNEINIPVAVLTNGYTASASELLTGALRDYNKATIIGTNSFGKGIVQSIYFLNDGAGMKITTSSYFTPNGECFHGYGIKPDIEVEFDSEAYYASDASNRYDNQKIYAHDYLVQELNK